MHHLWSHGDIGHILLFHTGAILQPFCFKTQILSLKLHKNLNLVKITPQTDPNMTFQSMLSLIK